MYTRIVKIELPYIKATVPLLVAASLTNKKQSLRNGLLILELLARKVP